MRVTDFQARRRRSFASCRMPVRRANSFHLWWPLRAGQKEPGCTETSRYRARRSGAIFLADIHDTVPVAANLGCVVEIKNAIDVGIHKPESLRRAVIAAFRSARAVSGSKIMVPSSNRKVFHEFHLWPLTRRCRGLVIFGDSPQRSPILQASVPSNSSGSSQRSGSPTTITKLFDSSLTSPPNHVFEDGRTRQSQRVALGSRPTPTGYASRYRRGE